MQHIRKELHWGRLISCYAERPANINAMLVNSFEHNADGTALVDGVKRIRYSELECAIHKLAAGLAAVGVKQGERVAIMLENQWETVLAVMAVSWLGAVVVPLGTRLRKPEISYIFQDAQPVAVIYGSAFAEELPEAGPSDSRRIECGGALWQSMLETGHAACASAAAVSEHDTFGILYTSGTTGKPKGAVLTHLNVVHSCLHWVEAHQLGCNERTLLCIPWSHVAGLCGVVLPFLGIGGTLILMAEFKRRDFLELAQKEQISHALLVPAMYGLCLLEPDLDAFDLRSWRVGVYGSAPMPEPTIERFAKAFPQLQMCNGYGATETTSPAAMMPRGDGVVHAKSVGKAVPCGEILIMDEYGRQLPFGEEGELWIAGPMVVPRYWNNPEADVASFVGGYWKSGDVGTIDETGYVYIADRKKDMINRGGFKVYPAEVESVLMGIEKVIEAAVIGHPDEILGETVLAFLTVSSDALAETDVRSYCIERMADYKVPSRVIIGKDPLPRNANGKIQKAELRETAQHFAPVSRLAPGAKR